MDILEALLAVFGLVCALRLVMFRKKKHQLRSRRINADEWELTEPKGQLVDVVGESHENLDGTKRYDIIAKLSIGDPVQLIAEPDNEYSNSGCCVAVYCRYGQIGFLPDADELTADIFRRLENRELIGGSILSIFGGTIDKPHFGLKLDITL